MVFNPNFKDLVHYSEELENAIIGICMIEPLKTPEVIAMIQTPEIFYFDENKMIFNAIKSLKENFKPVDMITVCIEVGKNPHPAGDKWQYVTALKIRDVVNSSHINEWCRLLVQFYLKREQIKFQTNLGNYEDPLQASHDLNETLKKAMAFKNFNDWSDMSQLMLELQNRREQIKSGKIFGIKTGMTELDELCGGHGFQTGFHVICSRPGMGKSAFALSVINNMVNEGNTVGMISLEMPNVQLSARLISIRSGIDFRSIFNGPAKDSKFYSEQREKDISDAILAASNIPLFVSDKSRLNSSEISMKAEKLVRHNGAKAIFIDYLQLIEVVTKKNEQRYVAVGNLSRELKLLSTELDVPIIALAQVNRESEGSDKISKPAKISQLRESGSIEQDVDMGISIDRPFKRGLLIDEDGKSTEGVAFIDVQKHRNGAEKLIKISFNPKIMKFLDEQAEYERRSEFPQIEIDNVQVKPSRDLYATPPNLLINNNDLDVPF